MTNKLRVFAGATVLAAGLWFLSGAAAAPTLPTDSYKKAAAADLAFLNKRLDELAEMEKPKDGVRKPALTAAVMLSVYGDILGDPALKADALKVAEALMKKDIKGAAALAKTLAVKPGAAAGAGGLPKLNKFDLELVMNPFRAGKAGGMNIEKDIRDMLAKESPLKVDPAAVEILATRTAVLGEFGLHFPNDAASTPPANKAQWDKWMKEMVDVSKQLAEEGGKGAGADEKKILGLVSKLNAKCSDCHAKFRTD